MSHRAHGFILVLVLWVLLALTLAASALATWVSRTTDQALLLADERRGQVDVLTTLETLKFLFATRPTRVGGLYLGGSPQELAQSWRSDLFSFQRGDSDGAELPLDGRLWQGLGKATFSVQDPNGLLNAQGFAKDQIEAWLASTDLSPLQVQQLIENLLEFIRGSRQASLIASEYRAAGLEPPPRRFLLTPMEALKARLWSLHKQDLDARHWDEFTSVFASGSLNLNTAPRLLLLQHPKMSVETARLVAGLRRQQPFRTAAAAAQRVNRHIDSFSFITLPASVMRVTVAPGAGKPALRYTLVMTATAEAARPWRVGYVHPVRGAKLDSTVTEENSPAVATVVPHPLFSTSQ